MIPSARVRLRARSKKRQREMILRRRLVARLLEERPVCEIAWDAKCTGRSTEVDEIIGRGRGGDFLDESNCQTACHYCHSQKTEHPAEARRRGLKRHSWEAS